MNTIRNLNNVEDSMPISPEVAVQDRREEQAMTGAEAARRPQRHVGLRSFVETLGAGFFIKGCGLIMGVFLARFLGPIGRGSFETAIFWAGFFAAFGLLGVDMAIKRRAATEHDVGPLTRTAFPLSLMLSVITIVVCYISLPYLLPHKQHQLLPLAVLFLAFIPANNLALNLQAIDEGTGHFRRFNLIRSILNPVWLLAILVMWLMGLRTVAWFVMALLLANYAVVVTRVVVSLRRFPLIGPIYPPFRILREGSPFALSRILELPYERMDRILIIWLLGPRALGLYVVALGAGSLLTSIGISANTVVFAIAAQSPGRGGFERSAKVFRGTAMMWLFAGGCLMLLIPLLLPIVYGSRFADAVLPGILLIVGSGLAMQARLLDSCFRGQGRVFPGITARLAAMITLAVLGLITYYAQWNLFGVTCAFVVAQAVYLCLLIVNAIKHYGKVASLQLIPTYRDAREALSRIRHYFSSR